MRSTGWAPSASALNLCRPAPTRTGSRDRHAADQRVVDVDLGALAVARDRDARDPRLEVAQRLLDLVAPRLRDPVAAALLRYAVEVVDRAGVLLQLERGLAQVVEQLVVRRVGVGALELDQRGAEVALAIEVDAESEVRARALGRSSTAASAARAPGFVRRGLRAAQARAAQQDHKSNAERSASVGILLVDRRAAPVRRDARVEVDVRGRSRAAPAPLVRRGGARRSRASAARAAGLRSPRLRPRAAAFAPCAAQRRRSAPCRDRTRPRAPAGCARAPTRGSGASRRRCAPCSRTDCAAAACRPGKIVACAGWR